MEPESLIEYPTDFPIKIMGRREPRLVQSIVEIVQRHAPEFDETTVELRTSKKNNYLSVTCTVRATSREQLDSLYRDLCDHPAVVMVLCPSQAVGPQVLLNDRQISFVGQPIEVEIVPTGLPAAQVTEEVPSPNVFLIHLLVEVAVPRTCDLRA